MDYRHLADKYRNYGLTGFGEATNSINSYGDLINLSLGDPDLVTDGKIIDAACEDAKKGHTHYTQPKGDPELIDEIIKHYKKTYGYSILPEEVLITVGACHGMFLALEAIINEGDEVIVHEPFFTPYKDQITLVGGKIVLLETLEENGFDIDITKLKSLITKKTKAIIINTPNNPTGACFNSKVLSDIAKVAEENDLLVISDEVYDSFSFEDNFVPITSISSMKERTITLGSFSKSYAMTGWRIGYAVAPKYIIDCMKNINEGVCYTAPSISQRAAIHALRSGQETRLKLFNEFKNRMFYAYERINSIPNMSVLKPKGSIYLFVNIKSTGMSSAEFSRKLLQEAHVLVIPGDSFGKSGEGYVRIACTVGIDKLKEAFDRIEKLFSK